MASTPVTAAPQAIRDEAEAQAYIQRICFKTGPPALIGAELEWTVHHRADPALPVSLTELRNALGPYAPPTLQPRTPHQRVPPPPLTLPADGTVTVEPGGQLEISTTPRSALTALYRATTRDERHLAELLDQAGLQLGTAGIDRHRPPRRLVHTERYAAMEQQFDRIGPFGRQMMCSTAGLQVCLDAGQPRQLANRWAAVHALGPPLLAAFANSPLDPPAGRGWASERMRCWLLLDPARTGAVLDHPATGNGAYGADPAAAWSRYAITAPLLCVRRPGGGWDAPAGLTLADWLAGGLPRRPTTDDIDFHLSTLFPWVRPRGYLELRYLDAQPPGDWIAPVAVLAALLADEHTTDAALDACAPAAGHWVSAARDGLASRPVAVAASDVLDLACRALPVTGLPVGVRNQITEIIGRRLAAGRKGSR